jgi:hypothetical protein
MYDKKMIVDLISSGKARHSYQISFNAFALINEFE